MCCGKFPKKWLFLYSWQETPFILGSSWFTATLFSLLPSLLGRRKYISLRSYFFTTLKYMILIRQFYLFENITLTKHKNQLMRVPSAWFSNFGLEAFWSFSCPFQMSYAHVSLPQTLIAVSYHAWKTRSVSVRACRPLRIEGLIVYWPLTGFYDNRQTMQGQKESRAEQGANTGWKVSRLNEFVV